MIPESNLPEERRLNKFKIDKDGKIFINGVRINRVNDYNIKCNVTPHAHISGVAASMVTISFPADIGAELIDRKIHDAF